MLTKRIFLASSFELKDERTEFEILINRKNKQWIDQGVFLELVVWEDFLDAMAQTRLQDEYNKAIRECDIFIMLFSTKVGPYTQEEFETAFGAFKAANKPLIYVYFKDVEITVGAANKKDLTSVWAFQEKLDALGHFYTMFKNIEGLKLHFTQQLEKLAQKGFFGKASNRDGEPQTSALAIGQGGVLTAGANQGTINTGTQQFNTQGGAVVIGGVHIESGNFIGHDWITQDRVPADNLDSLFASLMAAVATSAPTDVRVDTLVDALKAEVSKGRHADDNRMSRIVDQLAARAPGAIGAVVRLFDARSLSGVAGTMTSGAIDKLRPR